MQIFIELTACLISAIIFVALCGLATWIFQSIFHPENTEDLKLYDPDSECLSDDTLQYPLQHPTEYTDYR